MLPTRTPAMVATAAIALLAALFLTGCGDISDFPPPPSVSAGCTYDCTGRASKPIIPTPVPIPTLDPAIVAWRSGVHDRVAALMKDLGSIETCGGQYGDDRADCRTKLTALMTDARAMRDAMDPHTVPADAVNDAGKISDALDLMLQGCAHDDANLASNKEFVWLPGDTTSKAFQQLVAIDDGLRTA
jgi:hypothetical protein